MNQVGGFNCSGDLMITESCGGVSPPEKAHSLQAPIRKPFAYRPPGPSDRDELKPIPENAILELSPLIGPTFLLAVKYLTQSPSGMQEVFWSGSCPPQFCNGDPSTTGAVGCGGSAAAVLSRGSVPRGKAASLNVLWPQKAKQKQSFRTPKLGEAKHKIDLARTDALRNTPRVDPV